MAATATVNIPRVAVEIEGEQVCWATSVEASPGTGEVVERALPGEIFMLKNIGTVRYEPIRLTCGAGIASSLFGWMQQMLSGAQRAKNGSLITIDFDGSVVDRLNFTNALITGITLPALDARSQQVGQFVIELLPERTELVSSTPAGSYQAVSLPMARWLVSDFRVTIAGLDCTKVTQVDALPISLGLVQQAVGAQSVPTVVPSHLEIPDLSVSLGPRASDFVQWHKDFVIHPSPGAHEQHGQVDYLAPGLHDSLFSVTFDQLGIYKLTRSYDESTHHVHASMYCGRLQLAPGLVGQPSSSSSQPVATSAPPLSRVRLQDQAASAPQVGPRISTFTRVPSEGLVSDLPAQTGEAELIQRGFAPPYMPAKPKLDD